MGPSLASLAGILVPGQEMVNHFSIDRARGLNEVPPYIPSATGESAGGPWMPTDPAFTRSHDIWKKDANLTETPN